MTVLEILRAIDVEGPCGARIRRPPDGLRHLARVERGQECPQPTLAPGDQPVGRRQPAVAIDDARQRPGHPVRVDEHDGGGCPTPGSPASIGADRASTSARRSAGRKPGWSPAATIATELGGAAARPVRRPINGPP